MSSEPYTSVRLNPELWDSMSEEVQAGYIPWELDKVKCSGGARIFSMPVKVLHDLLKLEAEGPKEE